MFNERFLRNASKFDIFLDYEKLQNGSFGFFHPRLFLEILWQKFAKHYLIINTYVHLQSLHYIVGT